MALSEPERRLLLDNPDLFIAHYFAGEIQELEDFHLRLVTNATTKRRAVILYPAAHGKCCDPETPVLTIDGTLRRARDIAAGDELADGFCIASESNGIGPTLRVTVSTGQTIIVTPNHPFAIRAFLDDEVLTWVEARNLIVGDEVVLRSLPSSGAALSDEALALLGYVIGDGSVKSGNCLITSGDEVLRDHIVACCAELGFTTKVVGRDVRMSGGAREWLREIGLYGCGSYDKRVPAEVFRADNRQLRIFLAAYHACDGSFTQGRSGFEFYSVSEMLLRDVQHLLLRLGVVASLSRKNGRYLENAHQSWRLRIPSAHFDEVRRWPILLERKIPNRGEDVRRYLPKVVAVEDAGERETWALQTSTGMHVTADMLTHNTTLVSTILPIWALCRDPNVRITIIAKNDIDAKAIMRAIQSQLEGNDLLVEDFGPFKPLDGENKPWSLSEMSVHKRTRIHPRPTIQAKGSGANIFGHRSDWVICDDVVTDKNSGTPEAREKFAQWFHQGVETMPEHVDSRLTVVGTLFDPQDLYHDLMDTVDPTTGDPVYHKQHEDAIVDEDQQITLWPKRWPWRRLMLQKLTLGTLDFNKRYRNIAVDRSRLVFKEAYVKGGWHLGDEFPGCLDRDYEIGQFDETWHIYGGFDPAIGVKKNAKFVAHVTLAVGSCSLHERCFWVVDLERDQMTLPQQADMILDKHAHYGMLCSRIETNAYQKGLEQVVQERMTQRGIAFRIEPHTTGRNKLDPEIGVQAMAPWFERGAFHIPWATAYSQRRMRPLVDELITYPGRTTDTVMALWVAWTGAEQGLARYASFNRLEQRDSMWSVGRPRPLGCYVVENPIFRAD